MYKIDKFIDLCVEYFTKSKLPPEDQRNEYWYRAIFETRKISLQHQEYELKEKQKDDLYNAIAKIEGVLVFSGIPELRSGLDYVQIKPYSDQKIEQAKEILFEHNFNVIDETEDGEEMLIFFEPFGE